MIKDNYRKESVLPSIGDVIELTHEQQYLGQNINNVYYFQNNDVAGTLASLATWFETNVVPKIKAFQNNDLTHINLRLRNLFLDAEALEEPLTGAGARVAGVDELPSFFAASARFDHAQGGLRPGFKRWSGLDEGQIGDGLITVGTVALMVTACGELIQPPTTANVGWVPVVVQRICEIPNPDPEGIPSCLKYRLPENQGELISGTITAFEVNSQPTTQNSRKYYT